jgi:hypothetical protein
MGKHSRHRTYVDAFIHRINLFLLLCGPCSDLVIVAEDLLEVRAAFSGSSDQYAKWVGGANRMLTC